VTSAPWTPGALALRDLDGDGEVDLVVADLFFGAIVGARGDGTGAFTFAGQVPGFIDPEALSLGGVSGDAGADLGGAGRGAHAAGRGMVSGGARPCPLFGFAPGGFGGAGEPPRRWWALTLRGFRPPTFSPLPAAEDREQKTVDREAASNAVHCLLFSVLCD